MNLHEFQAKQLFASYDIPVPHGKTVRSVPEAVAVARALGGDRWVAKVQVHAGGRGKAGGVKVTDRLDELEQFAARQLGARLATGQSHAEGLPVNVLLVEKAVPIARELYLGMLVERASARIVFMASEAGGMDIEQVAAEHPEKILKVVVDPVAGLQAYQCRRLGFGLGLDGGQVRALTGIMNGLYRLFEDKDVSLVEVNPLVVTEDGALLALDGKVNLDDNALYRQSEVAQLRDVTQEDATEHAAARHGLNYITLDGNIACMVNGAGLAMATMDLIKLHGGEPANFLDVGGGTTADKVAEAFKLIASDRKVKAILVNIFGGIVRCDMIAEGIVTALREVSVELPIVVRLEGTNAEQGRAMLAASGLPVQAVEDLTAAAQAVVAAAR